MPNMKEITVGLRFTADTQQAKAQLASLKTDLINLSSLTTKNQFGEVMINELNQANIAAAKLKAQLDAATNVKTGNLDLSKFNKQLQMGGNSLAQYKMQLTSMGPAGQQAFLQLANSIQSAEMPLIRINKLFTGLWENLKRTAGWQISSTAIHAFMGAIQGAYHYAQDLNESLNNIRIVTGKSIDDMKAFAEQANKAAKALSTTTKAYTDASLIFYQQGLDGQAVEDRTNVVIKMANVTGQSAETVSDQMTAVWNNFAKGGQDLESFADKMTALGAATASSTDEIAGGLEKFAAVADTVGLSFDYAATALATITAITRQSEDTVGTALKTIFARLDGLKLGETLEDGTELNKYSGALLTVGVNIKDANGELKRMDDILDELGAKWGTLSKDTQTAVAQTVAGTRQYNQLIALMDNWGTFQKNLQVSQSSSGTLQKQADIYAESWEAAQKRVKAAAETLYTDLINDEFFIDLTDNLAKILEFVDKLIKSMGGLPGLLSGISALVFTIAGDKIANGIRSITLDIQNLVTGGAMATQMRAEAEKYRAEVISIMSNGNEAQENQIKSYSRISELQSLLTRNAKKLSDEDLIHYQNLIQIQRAREEENQKLKENIELVKKERQENFENAGFSLAKFTDSGALTERQERLNQESRIAIGQAGAKKRQINALEKKSQSSELSEAEQQQLRQLQQEYDQLTRKINSNRIARQRLASEIEAMDAMFGENASLRKDILDLDQSIHLHMEEAEALNTKIAEYELAQEKLSNLTEGTEEYRQAEDELRRIEHELIDLQHQRGEINSTTAEQKHQEVDATRTQAEAEAHRNEVLTESHEKLRLIVSDIDEEIAEQRDIVESLEGNTEARQEYLRCLDAEADANAKLRDSKKQELEMDQAVINSHKLLTQAIGQASAKIQNYATKITTAVRVASSLTMATTSLVNVIKTFKNKDLSPWEKFSSLMMALPMIITPIAVLITQAVKGFQAWKTTLASITAVQDLFAQSTTKTAIANRISSEITDKGTKLGKIKLGLMQHMLSEQAKQRIQTELQTVTEARQQLILAKGNEKLEEEAKKNLEAAQSKLQNTLVTEGLATEETKKIVADDLETKATEKNTASIWKNIAARIAQLGWIALAVAAIAALIAIIYLSVKAYNKDADAAKKSAEHMKLAKDAANEATEAYEKLKNTINDYTGLVDKIQGLVKGTTEFRDAVNEANQKALELIRTVNGLQYHYDSNGLIVFENGELEKAQNIQQQQTYQAQSNALLAEYQATSAQQKSNRTNFERDVITRTFDDFSSGVGNTAAATGIGAGVGAALGAAIAGIFSLGAGAGVGAAIGAKIGAIAGPAVSIALESVIGNASKNEDIALQAIQDKYENDNTFRDIFAKYGVGTANYDADGLIAELNKLPEVTGDIADALGRNAEKLEEFLQQQEQINQQQRAILKEGLNEIFMQDEAYADSKYKEYILNRSLSLTNIDENSPEFQEAYKNYKKRIGTLLFGAGFKVEDGRGAGSGGEKNVAAEYLIARFGEEAAKNYQFTNFSGTNWTLQKKNEDGVWEDSGTISQDDVAKFLALNTLRQEALGNLENLTKEAETYSKSLEELGIGLTDEQREKLSAEEARKEEERYEQARAEILAAFSEGRTADLTYLKFSEIEALKKNIEESAGQYDEAMLQGFSESLENSIEAKKEANLKASSEYFKNRDEIEAQDLQSTLTAVEMTKEAFDSYVDSILENNKATMESREEAEYYAKQTLKTSLAVKNLSKLLTENTEDFNKLAEGNHTLSASEADLLEHLRTSLSEWLEVDFTNQELIDNLELIRKVANGDTEALKELNIIASKKMVADFDIDDTSKEQFYNFIDDINNQNLTIGAEIDLTNQQEFLANLDKMVQNGEITAQEIEKAMKRAGANLEPTEYVEKPAGSTKSYSTVKIKDDNGERIETWETETDNMIMVPKYSSSTISYDGGNNTTTDISFINDNSQSNGSSSKGVKIDPYRAEEHELDIISKKLDIISKKKDKAWGKEKIALIKAETDEIERQGQVYQRELAIAEEELNRQAKNVTALGLGVVFDEEGKISNLDQIVQDLDERMRKGGIDKDVYSQTNETIDAYNDALSKWYETSSNIIDIESQKIEKQLETIDATIDVKLKLSDVDLKRIEFQLKQLENKAFAQAERLTLYTAQANIGNDKFNTYADATKEVLRAAGATEDQIASFFAGDTSVLGSMPRMSSDVIDKLLDNFNNMTSAYDEMTSAYKEIGEQLNNLREELNNEFEKVTKDLEFNDSTLGYYRNLIDAFGEKRLDKLGISNQIIESLQDMQVKSIEAQRSVLESQLKMGQENLKAIQENLEKAQAAGDENAIKFWKDQEQAQKEANQNITKELQQANLKWVEEIKKQWDLTIENMIKGIEEVTTGVYKSIDALSDAYDKQKTLTDQMLPEYQKAYELNKLNRDISKKINESSSLRTQQKLRDFQKEINDLQKSGQKMSEYDLNILQKRYDLRVAEIALEEAQNAKTQVRLTRDQSGGYAYVYTANEDKVSNAQSKYEEALNNLLKYQNDTINNMSKQLVQTYQEMMNAIQEAQKSGATEEELARIEAYYRQRMDFLSGELDKTLMNNRIVSEEISNDFTNLTDNLTKLMSGLTTNFNDTILGELLDGGYNSATDWVNNIQSLVGSVEDNSGLLGTLATGNDLLVNTLLDQFGDLNQELLDPDSGLLSQIGAEFKDLTDKANELGKKGSSAFGDLATGIKNAWDEMKTPLTDMVDILTQIGNMLSAIFGKEVEDIEDDDNNSDNSGNVVNTPPVVTPERSKYTGFIPTLGGDTSKSYIKIDRNGLTDAGTGIPSNITNWIANNSDDTWHFDEKQHWKRKATYMPISQYSSELGFESVGSNNRFVWGYRHIEINNHNFDIFNKCKTCGYIKFRNDFVRKEREFGEAPPGQGLISDVLRPFVLLDSYFAQFIDHFEDITGFATGGYTGDWGTEGHLAVLHEKELVLNKEDTENMLNAVNTVRELSRTIDLQALTNKYSQLVAMTAPQFQFNSTPTQDGALEQQITINAEFPGVQTAAEIEQAFDNLYLQASQYANRNYK